MRKIILSLVFFLFLTFVTPFAINAQPNPPVPPKEPEKTINLGDTVSSSKPLQIIVLLTLLSFIPAILISMTCFTRLIVVFHFLRQALGTQETPNNQVLLGFSLFITLFVMSPTLTQVYNKLTNRCRTAKFRKPKHSKKVSFRFAIICSNTRGKAIWHFF